MGGRGWARVIGRAALACVTAAVATVPLVGESGAAEPSIGTRQAKLDNGDAGPNDLHGFSVDVSGNFAVTGAVFDAYGGAALVGSAYVFARSGTKWREQAKLRNPELAIADVFGWDVAIDGTYAVVTAPLDDVGTVSDAGSAHVFVRTTAGWVHQATLTAPTPTAGDSFGGSVAIDGSYIAVGAVDVLGNNPLDAGSVHVFHRVGATWTHQVELVAADTETGDHFGFDVALAGPYLAAGSPFDDRPEATDAGSAHVFLRSGATWAHQAQVTAPAPTLGDAFGESVAATTSHLFVGSPHADTTGGVDAGSAYVFQRDGAAWVHRAVLQGSSAIAGSRFGTVDVEGTTAVIGAGGHLAGDQAGAGAAYVFTGSGAQWTQTALLTAESPAPDDALGADVAVSGATVLAGASPRDTSVGVNAGSAIVFTRAGSTWSRQAELFGTPGGELDLFGLGLAVSGGTLITGAPTEDPLPLAQGQRGSATIWQRSGSTWARHVKLRAPGDASPFAQFGAAVALVGDYAVVGAPHQGTGGAVYVYFRTSKAWSLQATLVPDEDQIEAGFGTAVALSGTTLLVGAPGELTEADESGAVYAFTRSGSVWTRRDKLVSPAFGLNSGFGRSVALSGATAVVGLPARQQVALYLRSGTEWELQRRIHSPDEGAGAGSFGIEISLTGTSLAVGDPGYTEPEVGSPVGSGRAYVFHRADAVWSLQATLSSDLPSADAGFGGALAVSSGLLLVGEPGADDVGTDDGVLHRFRRSAAGWLRDVTAGPDDVVGSSRYGSDVAMSTSVVAVAAPAETTAGGAFGGAVYVYG